MTYIEYLFQHAPTKGFAHLQTQGALCNLFSFVRCMRPFQRKRLYKMYTLKPLGNPNNHWNITRLLPVNIIKTLFNGYILFWTNRQSVLCTRLNQWYVCGMCMTSWCRSTGCYIYKVVFVSALGLYGFAVDADNGQLWSLWASGFFLSSFENGTWKDIEERIPLPIYETCWATPPGGSGNISLSSLSFFTVHLRFRKIWRAFDICIHSVWFWWFAQRNMFIHFCISSFEHDKPSIFT